VVSAGGYARVVPGNAGDAAVGGTLDGCLRALREIDAFLGLIAPVCLQQPVEDARAAVAVAQPLGRHDANTMEGRSDSAM
jgi:hypothetical protein